MGNDIIGVSPPVDGTYPGYIVYRYTNTVNGKMYVGITKQGSISKRFNNGHGYYNRCPHLGTAIKKYGWDAFEKEIVAYGLTVEEAESLEIDLIARYDLTNPSKGYNIKTGGHLGKGMSAEGRASMHEQNCGLNAPKQRPVIVFDTSGNKIGEFPLITFAADHYGIKRGTIINHLRRGNHPCFGMIFKYKDEIGESDKLSEEELKRYLEKKDISGSNSYMAKAVVIFDSATGKRIAQYGSIKDACLDYSGDILGCLRGKHNAFGDGYTVRYLDDVGDIDELPQSERYDQSSALPNNRRIILQYSKDGTFIGEYPSMTEASRQTGIGMSNIQYSASHSGRTAGGYVWVYKVSQ